MAESFVTGKRCSIVLLDLPYMETQDLFCVCVCVWGGGSPFEKTLTINKAHSVFFCACVCPWLLNSSECGLVEEWGVGSEESGIQWCVTVHTLLLDCLTFHPPTTASFISPQFPIFLLKQWFNSRSCLSFTEYVQQTKEEKQKTW